MATTDTLPSRTERSETAAAGAIAVENPATGAVIGHVPAVSAAEVAELRATRACRTAGVGGARLRRTRARLPSHAVMGRRQRRSDRRDDLRRDRQGL